MESPTCKRELIIEVPPGEVARESEQITSQYARMARIPGFRPGKAPRALVGRRFREEIRSEVVQTLVPRYFEDRVRDEKLHLAGEPRFDDLKFEEGQPIRAKAIFEVYPEFELKDYKGLEVDVQPATVTDADVDQAIERLRERNATFEVIEGRPAAKGDYVMVSYRGQNVENAEAEPIEAKEGMILLGGERTVPGFTENLTGTRAGDTREFEVRYNGDFPRKSLAGQIVKYRVEVQGIKKKVIPPADDEFAKSVSDFSSLGELRDKVHADLETQKQKSAENAAKQALMERLVASYNFPVPETLVDERLRRRLERFAEGLAVQGVDPEAAQIDWRALREEMRADAEKDVREALLLDAVAKAEDIEVTAEELDDTVREIAEGLREAPAAVKSRLTRNEELDKLQASRRNLKALDFIYRNAKINHSITATVSGPVEGESPAGLNS
ncbi:MAG TPA: trigger factor [Terriglobia bacterium]|nr:trigger factor [Terriglobia bacterium]